ncbi:hypothetical protein [Flavobacterium xinjiangense]|uniref:Uncharacterized protein n=1 Tax=Flavobacterium xinjiangense TaxID=178356 RepID=A0A1M7L2G6_9FLAO|nr:hypothetical protein [Flavobacterium xinjiangense]SHM72198.1 hypothetical protein SAMN05216269_106164 [Flavobacterium xinjiangense]
MKQKKQLESELQEAYSLKRQMFTHYESLTIFQDKRGFYGQIEELIGLIDALESTIYNREISFKRFRNAMR